MTRTTLLAAALALPAFATCAAAADARAEVAALEDAVAAWLTRCDDVRGKPQTLSWPYWGDIVATSEDGNVVMVTAQIPFGNANLGGMQQFNLRSLPGGSLLECQFVLFGPETDPQLVSALKTAAKALIAERLGAQAPQIGGALEVRALDAQAPEHMDSLAASDAGFPPGQTITFTGGGPASILSLTFAIPNE